MGVVGLELGVEVDLAVGGVVEAVQPDAGVLVGAVGHDPQLVVGRQPRSGIRLRSGVVGVDGRGPPVERDLAHGGGVEVDERGHADQGGARSGRSVVAGGTCPSPVVRSRPPRRSSSTAVVARSWASARVRLSSVIVGQARMEAGKPARRVRSPSCASRLVCPYSLTVPGGVQGQVLGLARALRAMGHEARVLGPVRRPAARGRRHPPRQQHPHRGQRLDGAHRPRPLVRPAHHPRPARRGLRRRAPARAARARARP